MANQSNSCPGSRRCDSGSLARLRRTNTLSAVMRIVAPSRMTEAVQCKARRPTNCTIKPEMLKKVPNKVRTRQESHLETPAHHEVIRETDAVDPAWCLYAGLPSTLGIRSCIFGVFRRDVVITGWALRG